MLIEADVNEVTLKKAEPVVLNAVFEEPIGEPYHYNVTDKVIVDKQPPAAIQITKLPKKGNMKTKARDGQEKIVQVGDIVPAESMESFIYDQEVEICAIEHQENCKDTFSFIPLSSW